MIVAGDHVLRAEVHKRRNGRTLVRLYERSIPFRHVMGARYTWPEQRKNGKNTYRNDQSLLILHHKIYCHLFW